MRETRFRADVLCNVGEEGDDVVLHFPFDFVDALDVELALGAVCFAALLGIVPSSAIASIARVSISSQMAYRFSGDQIAVISGRE